MPPQGHPVFCASDNNYDFCVSPYFGPTNQYSRAQPASPDGDEPRLLSEAGCNFTSCYFIVSKLQTHA